MFKKVRKPRGMKLRGTKSKDMCPHCVSVNCDPFLHWGTIFDKKKNKRFSECKCVACGKLKEECSCKSSLEKKP